MLASLGITTERLQQARERSFIDPYEPTSGWRRVNPAFQLVLERANLEAVLLADAEVTSEHVLLALASHWAADATAMALPPRGDLDPAAVRRRVLEVTEGMAIPPPPAPDAARRIPRRRCGGWRRGWSWRVTPAGKDPRRRMPWGSRIFVDADGQADQADRSSRSCGSITSTGDGNPVLTSDGQAGARRLR